MTTKKSKAHIIERRGQLIAELFLQDLNPSFVARPTSDFGYDFLIGFPNTGGGINNCAVRVEATERPVPPRFPIDAETYRLLAHSNIPALLIVADVKRNRLFHAEIAGGSTGARRVGSSRQIAERATPGMGPRIARAARYTAPVLPALTHASA